MSLGWNSTTLNTEAEVIDLLIKLRGKRWLCRGQAKRYPALVPSIDRGRLQNCSRIEKLTLERRSIDLFRDTARFIAHPGEQGALDDDIIALMVLRHYGVPTRLLDWSMSPYVAAYFAVCNHEPKHESKDGEIWTFDHGLYAEKGKKQWRHFPETTIDGSGDDDKFDAKLTAFTVKEPPDTFNCGFYPTGFPRQKAQAGLYTMTARLGRDHAKAISNLLADSSHYHHYVVAAPLKPALRRLLRESHGIWRGSLFPDSAGAADTAKTVFCGDGA
jgi:hypothetical protein